MSNEVGRLRIMKIVEDTVTEAQDMYILKYGNPDVALKRDNNMSVEDQIVKRWKKSGKPKVTKNTYNYPDGQVFELVSNGQLRSDTKIESVTEALSSLPDAIRKEFFAMNDSAEESLDAAYRLRSIFVSDTNELPVDHDIRVNVDQKIIPLLNQIRMNLDKLDRMVSQLPRR